MDINYIYVVIHINNNSHKTYLLSHMHDRNSRLAIADTTKWKEIKKKNSDRRIGHVTCRRQLSTGFYEDRR